MAGFKGQAEYSVDSKGRVAIPAKMRAAMNPEAKNTFTVTRGFERCVVVYALDHWQRVEDELAGLNMYRAEARNLVRSVMMWAEEVSLDAQGRIGLPRQLLEFAGIQDRALIIGSLTHIEIWNPELFDQHLADQSEGYEELAERVMGM
ncbi:MAG: division/cell wall cluster transcriptional repressor MraZ [Rhodothermales bacterium]